MAVGKSSIDEFHEKMVFLQKISWLLMKPFFLRILILVALLTASISSARGQLQFVQKEHDFGQIVWHSRPTVTVSVLNKGAHPVVISDIRLSHSEITADWPHTPILPGATIDIRLAIDAQTLGHFDRSVAVYCDSLAAMQDMMHLKGYVVRQQTEDADASRFPYHVGKVYLTTNNIEFDDVTLGQHPQQVIGIYNAGSDVYKPELMHLPKYITVQAQPERILPGRSGQMVLTLDSRLLPGMGLIQTSIYVSRYPGDNVGPNNDITISSVLLPAFDSTLVRQQAGHLPVLQLSSDSIVLPPFGKKDKAKGKISIVNTGNNTLEISSLQIFNPALSVSLSKSRLAPGAKATLAVIIRRSLMKMSHSRPRVLMITNDPHHPKVIFDVKPRD